MCFFGLSLIFNLADKIIPSVPSDPVIILCESLIDFILSILYPEEFLVTLGIFSHIYSLFVNSKSFFDIFLLSGSMIFIPISINKCNL